MCKEKIFQLQSIMMLNAIIYDDQRFNVKNSGISCLTLILNLSNPRMTILLAKNGFKFAI